MASRVVHCKRESYDVYIGRPSKWGNPFVIGPDGDRPTVIKKYEEWLMKQPALMAALPQLRDKTLGCWCSPQACHGDVLVRLATARAGEQSCLPNVNATDFVTLQPAPDAGAHRL